MGKFLTFLADNSEKAAYFFLLLFIAIFGAITKYVSRMKKDPNMRFSLSGFLGECFVACFSGLMMALICSELALSFYMAAALCGLAGYIGGRALELAEEKLVASFDKTIDKWTKK